MIWTVALVGGALRFALEALGFVVPHRGAGPAGHHQASGADPRRAAVGPSWRLVTFGQREAVVLDARAAALAAAAVVLMLRAPSPVAAAVGAATAAVLRAL
jgi:hypothetical protein